MDGQGMYCFYLSCLSRITAWLAVFDDQPCDIVERYEVASCGSDVGVRGALQQRQRRPLPGDAAILKLDAERRQRAILQQTLQQELRNESGRALVPLDISLAPSSTAPADAGSRPRLPVVKKLVTPSRAGA